MAQHKLVIAEKPSVAQSLAAVIGATVRKDGYLEGNGWRVSCAWATWPVLRMQTAMTPSMPSGDMMTCLFCRSIGRW